MFGKRRSGKRPYAAPTATNTMRDQILLDHLINLTDQCQRLAEMLRAQGLAVPDDLGTLGPASEEVVARLTRESLKQNLGQDAPW